MKNKTWSVLMVAGFCAVSSQMALATAITPTYDSIGAIPGATFNGTTTSSGIPNSDVARATYTDANGDKVHIGLEAFGRYSNPVIGPNVGGTYAATAGFNNGLTSPPSTPGPTWDFGWYLQVVSGSANIMMRISDNTTGVSKDLNFGVLGIGEYSDAWNLSMGFISSSGFPYDPYANGNYGIQLGVADGKGAFVGVSDAININVTGGTNVPDGGSTVAMLGFAACGLLVFKRASNRRTAISAK